ncbi:o-succinylbenzoate--CoA ligase [Kroppenstedtia sanguinis]|uniref:2-succinylbenzoate--CoA ligase n=1 Tax=Kroppenstedtia sanguinis TaxID=1380684 RepID=A0ABW4C581_9BACL
MLQSNGLEMPHWLAQRASLTPQRIALVCDGEEWTFRRLEEEVGRMARRLAGWGLKPGDRVALWMGNGLHMVTLIHAVTRLGAVVVPLNTRLSPKEVAWQVEDAGVRMWVVDADHESQVTAVEGSLGPLTWNELTRLPEAEMELPSRLSLNDLHTIMYTSGTTGRPKGVMLTWGNHWWSATGSVLNLGLDTEDRWLAAVPLFHMSGLSILMRSLIYGMTAVIHSAFDPAEANRSIREAGVTIVSVVGTMLTQMLKELGEEVYPNHFRCMLLGGGPAPKPLLEQCKDKGVPVFQTYGMTETASQIVTLAPEDSLRKLGSAGKPLFPSELRIVKQGLDLPPGEAGEIAVRGPNVTRGYWKRRDATRDTIREGWLYTGDLGYLDEEGFLYVLDRRSDLIISGGENVYPAEVEAVLTAHPAVEDAGVIGTPHQVWGQVPVGFVRLKPGTVAGEEELVQHCRERLAGYKVPVQIHFVSHLPKNASNKLLRRELLRWVPREGNGGKEL